MIYLYCERCCERRLFRPAEEQPPFDPNMALCSECGLQYGYQQVTTALPGRIEVSTRPVLDAAVVAAGLEEFKRERLEQLRARGRSLEHLAAQQVFESTEGDPEARRRLTSATATAVDPELAQKILRPQLPKK